MSRFYMYVVDRDFGFAPNPFHGACTLATCKAGIRSTACIGDWVVGVGGARLAATGRCIFAMRVTEKRTFNEYWSNPAYLDKKPVRNGSRKMMVGDNIYYYDAAGQKWHQSNSHHSNADGSINVDNLRRDTRSDKVLVSRHFYYFGRSAQVIPLEIRHTIGFKNGPGHRVFQLSKCTGFIAWVEGGGCLNEVQADPFDFDKSERRYSARSNRVF